MNHRNRLMAAAAGSLLVVGLVSSGVQAAESGKGRMEKCFGIARAGMNNCSSNKSAHACAGQAVKDGDPMDFVLVPKGTCDRIVNGSTQPGGATAK